ncbi:MAG: SDR family oxidoreductase [Rhodovibrionaceae bacterium]|nr:SDR family oxidoreductase [Rhodovibrionaceae bacterium]
MSQENPTALITGASSGIGRELARLHARRGNLVLVARRTERLNALKDEVETAHGRQVTVLAEDLSDPQAPARIHAATQDANLTVDYLVNNAGFGGHGLFHERAAADDRAMIEVNVQALTALSHLYLPGMVERGFGRVMNMASTAGFLPGPLQATYYATKAYVLSLSEALAKELEGTGVTVTTVCPGPVATEFVERADLEGVKLFDKAATPASVARAAYRAMDRGRRVAITDPGLAVALRGVVPFLPRSIVLAMSRKAMEKR